MLVQFDDLPSLKILQVISNRKPLRLRGAQEILHDRVSVISKGDLDRSIDAMNVSVVAGSLIGFMLFHEREKLLRGPALGLKVVVI
jgi:hypothetical protein